MRIVGQAHRLADLAHGGAAAIRDDGGGESRLLLTVFFVDVSDDLVAFLVLEIDVDVRRFVAFGRDETLEQERREMGVDLRDAQAITDDRIGGSDKSSRDDNCLYC